MQRDYETRLDEAVIAAMEGATPEEIETETSLRPEDIRNVIRIVDWQKRKGERRGTL